ncbi:MAG: DUF1287 domain-containing protein [Flavobacteriales bacterium]
MYSLFLFLLGLCLNLSSISAQDGFYAKLAASAESLTEQHVFYDPAYYVTAYPNADVPADRGVCADAVIRAYCKQGIDLQGLVHEGMRKNFAIYPQKWGLKRPNKNIDHRRVPNLVKYFECFGEVLTQSGAQSD